MPDAYLSLAKSVLRTHGRPMSAKEIIEVSKKYKLIPEHLHGKTMHKTLQARLSEDILENRFRSIFYRVSSGVFFLREFLDDDSISSELKKEFHAARRTTSPRKQKILCLNSMYLPDIEGFSKNYKNISKILQSNKSFYLRKDEAENLPSISRIMTFTIIEKNSQILLHRVGKFSEHYKFSEGYTIGLRSNVGEFDVDLMNDDGIGLKRNASREIFRNIYFSRRDLTDIDVMDRIKIMGHVTDKRRALAFVMMFNGNMLDMEIRTKKKLGFNQVMWCDSTKLHLFNVDKWSQEIAGSISSKVS